MIHFLKLFEAFFASFLGSRAQLFLFTMSEGSRVTFSCWDVKTEPKDFAFFYSNPSRLCHYQALF